MRREGGREGGRGREREQEGREAELKDELHADNYCIKCTFHFQGETQSIGPGWNPQDSPLAHDHDLTAHHILLHVHTYMHLYMYMWPLSSLVQGFINTCAFYSTRIRKNTVCVTVQVKPGNEASHHLPYPGTKTYPTYVRAQPA